METFLSNVVQDCIIYAQGYEACQQHDTVPRELEANSHAVIKPWSFRGWALDMIGEVRPTSIRRNCFILVATDYFTKLVECKPYRDVTERDVIHFIKK